MSRRQFRPDRPDALERREVLSGAAAPAIKYAALGDGYTDEYKSYTPDRSMARNWVEILASTRHLDFGRFSSRNLNVPRQKGFSEDWAMSGATSDAVVQAELPGLADQVRRGKVGVVAVFAGGEDFVQFLDSSSTALTASGGDPSAAVTRVENRAEENLTTVVRTLMLANPSAKLVLTTLPDVSNDPAFQGMGGTAAGAAAKSATSLAIAQFNKHVRDLAAEDPTRIALYDLAAQASTLTAQAGPSGSLTIGTAAIDTINPGDDYHHYYLADGVHPGTVAQAGIANGFISAFNTLTGSAIKPLSTAEILKVARVLPAR